MSSPVTCAPRGPRFSHAASRSTRGVVAGGQHLHRAVEAVADPAVQAQPSRLVRGAGAEPDALHAAAHDGVDPLHGWIRSSGTGREAGGRLAGRGGDRRHWTRRAGRRRAPVGRRGQHAHAAVGADRRRQQPPAVVREVRPPEPIGSRSAPRWPRLRCRRRTRDVPPPAFCAAAKYATWRSGGRRMAAPLASGKRPPDAQPRRPRRVGNRDGAVDAQVGQAVRVCADAHGAQLRRLRPARRRCAAYRPTGPTACRRPARTRCRRARSRAPPGRRTACRRPARAPGVPRSSSKMRLPASVARASNLPSGDRSTATSARVPQLARQRARRAARRVQRRAGVHQHHVRRRERRARTGARAAAARPVIGPPRPGPGDRSSSACPVRGQVDDVDGGRRCWRPRRSRRARRWTAPASARRRRRCSRRRSARRRRPRPSRAGRPPAPAPPRTAARRSGARRVPISLLTATGCEPAGVPRRDPHDEAAVVRPSQDRRGTAADLDRRLTAERTAAHPQRLADHGHAVGRLHGEVAVQRNVAAADVDDRARLWAPCWSRRRRTDRRRWRAASRRRRPARRPAPRAAH